ncbi:MAG: hypothetical protein HC802_17370 [Caldilineaceae bacterium]|nr:hypothetical protein [Caldilineaceae bacterium]
MTDQRQINEIAGLLKEAGNAHHQAFVETDGADAEWPIWYAEYLHARLAEALNASFTKSELVYLIVLLDAEQRLHAPSAEWSRYYAKSLATRYL